MAEETISYTIPAAGRKPEVTVNLVATYGSTPNMDGSYDVTDVSGTYTTTATNPKTHVTTVTTVDIVGLEHAHRRGNNDNRVYPNFDPSGPPIAQHVVNQHGITFLISDPVKHNATHTAEVNFYYSFEHKSFRQYGHDVSGNATDVTYSSSATVGSTAEADTAAAVMLCFAGGTLIRTARGDVAVERLAVGDLVVTASGARRPVRWLGHREVEFESLTTPFEAWPVRIQAGAFGAGLPERELRLSPGHPVLVRQGATEVLVPIMCLINGTTIARTPVDRVTYWHVELDVHDILLAEGLPAESFLDFGSRPWFAQDGQRCAADHPLMNPDFIPPGLGARCRPVAVDGPIVDAERRRLDGLFAANLAAAGQWPESGAFAL